MSTERVPAITLTNPFNVDSAPSPAQSPASPVKHHDSFELSRRIGSGRPVTPVSMSSSSFTSGRPESSTSRTSPSRLFRSLSNSGLTSNGQVRQNANGQESDGQTAIDPLSQQILNRTGTQPSLIPSAVLRPTTPESLTNSDERASNKEGPAPAVKPPIRRTETGDTTHRDLKKGVKAVSFLSRLVGTKKKDKEDLAVDDVASVADNRPEGNDVEVFAQPVDNMSYNPRHPQPPAYIKMRSRNKPQREFDRMFLAQELHCTKRRKLQRQDSNKLRRKSSAAQEAADTVWAMEFSRDGKYLAAAGADMIVRVWAVLSSSEDRQKHESIEFGEAKGAGQQPAHLSAPVFQSQPVREFNGHSSTILDLSWSKNNFLLSSSMDKTVRLWHVSRAECLCTFKHNDFVPSIAFHPKDDRFFLAGSLDSKLRLWSIPDKSVAFMAQLPDMITAVGFTPDGKSSMAGCLSGLCMFYETEGLKYQTQIHVRSTRGQNAKGSKITGIQSHLGTSGDTKVLITSNDSRVRLYNFRDKSLEIKFRGNENNCSQIRASISDDGQYVVCGSEDRKAYMWSMTSAEGDRSEKRPVEMFEAHNTITTCVAMAPAKTRVLLGRSEDPIYDLCNPPPIMLMSRAERAESQSSSKPPSMSGSAHASTPSHPDAKFERPKESPSYLARCNHRDGNIIVTADFTGRIKVFRQDCAWAKRRPDDSDRGSLFGKRTGRGSRTGSLATKTSQRSLREARTSTSTQAPSERILNWRQGIASTSNVAATNGSTKSNGSISPRKSSGQLSKPETQLRSATTTTESLPSTNPTSRESPQIPFDRPTIATQDSHGSPTGDSWHPNKDKCAQERNPLLLNQGGQSYMFWNSEEWKESARRARQLHSEDDPLRTDDISEDRNGHLAVRPNLNPIPSYVSELSDERSTPDDDEEFEDAQEHGDKMQCQSCGGTSFSARRLKEGMKLCCTSCGKAA